MLVERSSTEVTKSSLGNVEDSFQSIRIQRCETTAQAQSTITREFSFCGRPRNLGNRRSNQVGRCALDPGGIDTGYVVDIGRARLDIGVGIRCLGIGR